MPQVDPITDAFVRSRASDRCEYCLMPQWLRRLRFQIDHIIAKQHGGDDGVENLALCCGRCNRHKGPNLSSVDPTTSLVHRLYDPRSQRWQDHFTTVGTTIIGKTPCGRATIVALSLNHTEELAVREEMMLAGDWPPKLDA